MFVCVVLGSSRNAEERCMTTLKARLHRRFLSRNSMQFLSRRSCNFNIARVNQLRFQRDFIAAISQEFRTCSKPDAILLRFLIKM